MPPTFDAELSKYTREGLRVLALATRPLPGVSAGEVAAAGQEQLEGGLALAGLCVMVNPLRADTAGVIEQLQDAGIRTGESVRGGWVGARGGSAGGGVGVGGWEHPHG